MTTGVPRDRAATAERRSRDELSREPEVQARTLPRRTPQLVSEPRKDWYVIRVELTSGRGEMFDPPPGRDFLVSPQHSFRQFADVINLAFARWDLGHLYAFRFADGSMVGTSFEDFSVREAARTKIARRTEGETFDYEFDFGDSWEHRCTVLEAGVDPEDLDGVRPKGPVVTWGWGMIPDQYGRVTPDG
jgi:Plasmid pRiA4b ORF-3-like protein